MRITLAQGQYGAKSNQIFPGIELDMVGDFVTEAAMVGKATSRPVQATTSKVAARPVRCSATKVTSKQLQELQQGSPCCRL